LKLLGDESVDGPIGDRLRADGQEVLFVAEMRPEIHDSGVLEVSRDKGALRIRRV